MKNRTTLLLFIGLIYWGCEEEQDITPPTVTITFPQNNSSVSEMVSITCISSDNEGVEKVELWVNGVTNELTDNTEPYSFDWNTTLIDNGNYTITIRSYDTSDNTSDSDPIVLTVDNTLSNPQPVNITSVVFDNGGFTITWNQSTDGDFGSYDLEKSVESTMGNYDAVYTSSELTSTSYVDTDIDPLVYQYYRIAVTDTFDYETKGEIVSSSLDPVPSSVDVESVEYTLEEMTISWSESSDGDFRDYKLLYSETESGDRDTLVTYTDKSTISHTITEFDPTYENWFFVLISDTLSQSSIGNGMTHTIDSPPTQSEISPIVYEDGSFIIIWSQNNDDDFQSYILYESTSEDMSNQTEIFTSENSTDINYTVTGISESEIWYYQIKVQDYWGLISYSDVKIADSWIKFSQIYGGSNIDYGRCVQQTTDGGYIIAGETEELGGNNTDAWLIKTDSQGNEEWNQTFGGSSSDKGESVQQTDDGGYIITGSTNSFGNGSEDVWLIKTDSQGNEEWNQTFGGSQYDVGKSVQQTQDGGYIITGSTNSFGNGWMDVWLIKTDSQGNEEWNQTFGGSDSDEGYSVQETTDGGYIISGYEGDNGGKSIWIIKTDFQGEEEWDQNFHTGCDCSSYIQQTTDNGYIVTGRSYYGTNGTDAWLIKTDFQGEEEWNKFYGGSSSDKGESVQQTTDGGYIITGSTNSFGNGNLDVWLIKTDSQGNEEWNQTFGGSQYDVGKSVQQTQDGGYIITGSTNSFGNGSEDVWLIKTDSEGNTADYP